MIDASGWGLSGAERESEDIRASIYARTSKTSRGFGYSLDEQVRLCLERCEMYQWRPVFVFQDDGESGKDIGRPDFQALMNRAERRLFDVVVFWKLDRFSRSLLHAVQLEARLRKWDVALHSVTEQIDTTTSSGRFNFRSIASAAEFERDMIRERTKMGHTALAMEGRWPNSTPPIGYNLTDGGRLVVNESEASLIQDIFTEYISVKSMPDVAERLNADGILTKRGTEWCARSVGSVLRNRIYTGSYEVAGVKSHFPEYQIVQDELFNKATEVRNRFSSGEATRTRMPEKRKSTWINRVLDQYDSYISGTS